MERTRNFTLTSQREMIDYSTFAASLLDRVITVGFEATMNVTHQSCTPPASIVSYIVVGCPRERHLRVVRPLKSNMSYCDEFKDFAYKIKKVNLRRRDGSTPSSDLRVQYDYEKLGCPIRVHNSVPYLPDLSVYDGNIFVKEMTANYILWEEYGRTGWGPNSSMSQVYCIRRAQRAQDFYDMDSTRPLGELWTSLNYESCFESPETPYSAKKLEAWQQNRYEVYNISGSNSVILPPDQNGLFIFNVKVVDPHYSFCSLELQFPVFVYGAAPNANVFIIWVCLVVFLSLLMLLLLYTYFVFAKRLEKDYALEFNVDDQLG